MNVIVYVTPEQHIIVQVLGDAYATIVCKDFDAFIKMIGNFGQLAELVRTNQLSSPADIPQVFRDAFRED